MKNIFTPLSLLIILSACTSSEVKEEKTEWKKVPQEELVGVQDVLPGQPWIPKYDDYVPVEKTK